MTSTESIRDLIEMSCLSCSDWKNFSSTTFAFEHIWKIDKFPVLDQFSGQKSEEEMTSSEFKVDGHDLKFQMKLRYAGMHAENNQMNVQFSLRCALGKEIIILEGVKISLTIFDNTTVFGNYVPLSFVFKKRGLPFQANISDLRFSDRNSLHLINELKILLKFEGRYVKPTNFFLNQLELFKSGTLSDFTIVVENKHMPVHKVLLAARSPVFAAMFSQKDSKEVREGKVVILDFSFNVFKFFLAFVYIGVKPKQSFLNTELLKFADKYLVEELKQHCEESLSTDLSVLSVVCRFQVAFMHNAPTLKNNCLKFMANHFSDVKKTNDFKEMCNSGNGDLIFEAICGIAKNIQEQGENAKKKIRLS